MDINLQQKGLRNLARTAGEVAENAIRKSAEKITSSLETDVLYDQLETQLELLDIIAYRIHEESVEAIKNFLERLEGIELSYQEVPGFSMESLQRHSNKETLIQKALEVLEHIRYHQPEAILDVFFEYSCHENTKVAERAKQGIKTFSEFDLDIFYGDDKDWHGLGWQPQEKILEKISGLESVKKSQYFSAIIIACTKILSPTISGTSSNYKSFTWRTGAIPAQEGMKEIRSKAIAELQALFMLAQDTEQKKSVLNALETATNMPHMGDYGDDVLALIVDNTKVVINFMRDIAVSDDMQIMQKIEHDAYWLLYHSGELDNEIQKVALEIRDLLYADEEFKIFRVLVGFESIFHDWEKSNKDGDDYEKEREFRESEIQRLAKEIDQDTYAEWQKRIINYASIKSNDMAMFPYFGRFLEYFGKNSPDLALQMLTESSDQLENFIVAVLYGAAESGSEQTVYSLVDEWCNDGKYLFSLARFFEFYPTIEENILQKILDKAEEKANLHTLNQIIASVSAQYNEETKQLFKKFFILALKKLTANKNSGWVSSFWFRKQSNEILSSLSGEERECVLENLFWLNSIDYHAEEILCGIANKSPDVVIRFFCDRLSKEVDGKTVSSFDAIPYKFHKLSEPLSQSPEHAVNIVLDAYDGNYGLFIHKGARLLKNIFPDFPMEFQKILLQVIQSKKDKDFLFVMAILRNYEGKSIILDFCKELLLALPEESRLENELSVILQSTGVVSGEYGFANAYKQKIDEISSWTEDQTPRVVEFAKSYISCLEKQIEHEKKRVEEDITLRKYQFGSDED